MSEPLVSFDIWVQVPSQNDRKRMHWQAFRRLKLKFESQIHTQMTMVRLDPETSVWPPFDPETKIQLRLTQLLGHGCKKYDDDNFSAPAHKIIADALVRLGFIKDDSLKYVAPQLPSGEPIRDRSKPCGGVRVEILEVDS